MNITEPFQARCERDATVFTATPRPYPGGKKQSTCIDEDGDQILDCPTCKRGYMFYNGGSDLEILDEVGKTGWHSDRPLTVL